MIDFKPEDTTVKRLQEIKIKSFLTPITPRQSPEFRTYRIICRIKSYNTALDGDLCLELVDADEPEYTMFGEVPNPDCLIVRDSPYAEQFRGVWSSFRRDCVQDGKIVDDMERHAVNEGLYEVTGVCFMDLPHPTEGAADNYVELHPVLSIKKVGRFRYWLFRFGL